MAEGKGKRVSERGVDMTIDGNKLMMLLTDWWSSSFGYEENEESKTIKSIMDGIENNLEDLKPEPCEDAPSAQPTQSIAEWQKDFREYINMLNIPRDDYKGIMEYINDVPSAQPKILACGEGELDVPDTNAGDTIMKEVFGLIEDILDTLIEVGNGTTDEMLHEAADELFRVRDLLKKTVKDQEQEESEMEMRIIGVSRDHRELICSNGFRVVSGNGEFDVETMNQQLEEAGLPPLKEINPEPLIHGEYLDNMAAQYGIARDGRSDADLADAVYVSGK
jgi:hypothetical protein